MLKTEREKKICAKYSAKDENGKVHCYECPLSISEETATCKATAHYDRNLREWVFDDWEDETNE